MTIAREMAAFVVGAEWDDVPSAAQEALRGAVLDSLGCGIGALGHPGPVPLVREFVSDIGASGRCSLIGGGQSSPDLAAFYNGALIRYLDYNDTFFSLGESCHPSDNLSAVLAASEDVDQSGADFLTALGVAYQVQCRLSEEAPVRARGFDHTTQGAFAVAAGVARALNLDIEATTNAIAIAGTPSQALRVTRTGKLSHWKGLAYPMAASTAVRAAYLARQGITGPAEVFEGSRGFIESVSGPFEIDWSAEIPDAAVRVMTKRYNAEAHAQSTIAGLLELRRRPAFEVSRIARIEIDAFAACFEIIGGGSGGDRHNVDSRESADHSLPYIASVALLDGEVSPRQYTADRISRTDVQALLRRVTVREDPELTARTPQEMPVRIKVTLDDGTVFELLQPDFVGFPGRPLTWSEQREKFFELATGKAPKGLLDDIVAVVEGLERLGRIGDLAALLRDIERARVPEFGSK